MMELMAKEVGLESIKASWHFPAWGTTDTEDVYGEAMFIFFCKCLRMAFIKVLNQEQRF